MRLLLVDDNPAFLENAEELFAPLGEVTCCVHPQEALRHAHEHFDIVVSDFAMPQMTGVQLVSELRLVQPHLLSFIVTALPHRVRGFDGQVFEKVPVRPWLEAIQLAARAVVTN